MPEVEILTYKIYDDNVAEAESGLQSYIEDGYKVIACSASPITECAYGYVLIYTVMK